MGFKGFIFIFCATIFCQVTLAVEQLKTEEFLQISEVDAFPKGILNWDPKSFQTLHIPEDEPPYLILNGTLKEGYEISIQDKFVPVQNGKITHKLTIPMQPSTTFAVKIFGRNRDFKIYRIISFWKKIPSPLKLRIQDDEKIEEKVAGFQFEFPKSAFVQLYSKGEPCPVVDLDNQKHMELSFRIFEPPESVRLQDGWTFTIRNSNDEVIAEIKRFGPPPKYIDWREVAQFIHDKDTYFYQLDIYQNNQVQKGILNHFDTIERQAILPKETEKIKIEARQTFGFLGFMDSNSIRFQTPYFSPRFQVVAFKHWLLRAKGFFSLDNSYDTNRIFEGEFGLGIRTFGEGESKTFGAPAFFQLNLVVSYFQQWLPTTTTPSQIVGGKVLFEPLFVLWKQHAISPWVEYSTRFSLDYGKISAGLEYLFFVRPWSVKLGFGVAYDTLLYAAESPGYSYQTLRSIFKLEYVL